ncbi:MAG: sugar phosphate isomerase/epimerase family protein [Terriglobia bacterium]
MNRSSRRWFLQQTAALTASALAVPFVPALLESAGQDRSQRRPDIQFATSPKGRLAVASYPFRYHIKGGTGRHMRKPQEPAMTLLEFPEMVVKRFGVHGVEPLSAHFDSTDASYLVQFRAAVEKAGAHVVNVPLDERYSFYHPDAAVRQKAIATGKHWVDVAKAIGSPSIRAHIEGVHGVKPDVDRAAQSLGQLADYGASQNIVINLENDDPVSEDAFFVVHVIEKANRPFLHALPDFANSMYADNADFDYRAITAMFQHAYNISHAKFGEIGEHDKYVSVNVAKTFGIAKAAGYRGYFSMEWEGPGQDPFGGTTKLIQECLKDLSA